MRCASLVIRWLLLSSLVGTLVGCDSISESHGDFLVKGDYQGIITSNLTGTGTLNLSIDQDRNRLSGNWEMTFANRTLNASGDLSGLLQGLQVSLTLTPDDSWQCPLALSGMVMQNADRVPWGELSGTFNTFNCSVFITGTFDVSCGFCED